MPLKHKISEQEAKRVLAQTAISLADTFYSKLLGEVDEDAKIYLEANLDSLKNITDTERAITTRNIENILNNEENLKFYEENIHPGIKNNIKDILVEESKQTIESGIEFLGEDTRIVKDTIEEYYDNSTLDSFSEDVKNVSKEIFKDIVVNGSNAMGMATLSSDNIAKVYNISPEEALQVQKIVFAVGASKVIGGAWKKVGGKLVDVKPPKGTSYTGTVYRYEKPEYVETSREQHQGNIDTPHRYTGSGQGGTYAGTSQETSLKEIQHYDEKWETDRVAIQKDIKLENVLDLTNTDVRNELGINLEDITKSKDYTITNQIGKWAKENGYDGILAPSVRNPSGSNIVILKP